MRSMLAGCSGLTSLDVLGFDTSKVTDMHSMFNGCHKLTSLDVSGFDTGKVTDMSYMFYGCSSLTSLDVSGFDTSNVTNMSTMFYDCSGLTSLDVSGFDTSKVTDMSYMFSSCKELTSLDVSGFDTSKVTNMDVMFQNCSKLTSLDVSGFDTSKVTDMSYMFSSCKELTSLDVSGFDTSKVTDMSIMFGSCSNLASLDVSGFDTGNVINMNSMFYHCSKLAFLDLSDFDTSKVIDRNSIFNGCSNLTSIKFGPKTILSSDCKLSTPSDTSRFTGKWTLSDPYNHSGQLSSSELIAKTQKTKVIQEAKPATATKYAHTSNLDDAGSGSNGYGNNASDFQTVSIPGASKLYIQVTCQTEGTSYDYLRIYQGTVTTAQSNNGVAGKIGGTTKTTKTVEVDGDTVTFHFKSDSSVDSYYGYYAVVTDTPAEDVIGPAGEAAGLWVAERVGSDPKYQGYTSISANIYDAALHTNPDGTVKSGEDPVSLFRTEEGGSGYWQKLADNRWAYTFFVYKNDEVNWRVWEDNVSGYTGNYTIANPLDIAGSDIQKGTQPVITNTKNDKPLTGTLSLAKKTVSSDGSAFSTDQTFTFTVTLTGDSISGSQVFGDTPFADGTATVSLKNGESISFTDIPAETSYQISETQTEGFTGSIDKPSGTIPYNGSVAVTCTNTKQNQTKDYVSFTVTKKVVSNADESGTKFSFHASFTGLEINTTYQVSDGTSFSSDADGNANADFQLSGGQNISFQNIPAGAKYIVTEDGGEYLSSYKITDSAGVNKIVSSSGKSVQTDTGLSTSRETADKGENVQITFTNEITRTQDLVLTKNSVKADGSADTGDTNQYLVDVYISGLSGRQKIKTSNGILTADDDGIIETGMYISAGQKITFFDVPVGVKYRFEEEANNKIPSYNVTDTASKSTVSIVSASKANTEANTSLSTAEETVDAGENITVAFTNKSPNAAKLKVIKYDSSTSRKKLGGAEFALYKSDGTPVNFTSDGKNIITIGSSGESDLLESTLFVPGSYYLTETKAPDGYTVSGEPKAFEITADDAGKTLQIEVYDNKLVVFPVTGGKGNGRILSIALLLAAAAGSAVIYKKRRNQTA